MCDIIARVSTVLRRCALPCLILLATLTPPARVAAQELVPAAPHASAPSVDHDADAESEIATAPVTLDGAVLFRVRGVSSLPAAERARLIKKRLVAVAADRSIPVESLRLVEQEGVSRIQAGDRPLLGVVEADARLEQVARTELAAADLYRVREAISAYRSARSPGALRYAAARALAATLALAAALFVVVRLWRWVDRVLLKRLQARIHPIGVQSFEVMRAEQVWSLLQSTVVALRSVSILALLLTYTGFMLAQFPWTQGLSTDMVAFVIDPLKVMGSGFVESIPSIVFLVVLFFVVRLGLRMVRLFFDAVERGAVRLAKFEPEWAQPTYKFVRVGVVAFGLVMAYPYIPGSKSDAFQGVSLFLGLLFSLGASSSLANIIAGYMLIYRRAFRVGDRVKIGTGFGEVIETRLQVTHLRTIKNEELIIPNSQILNSEVLNYDSFARTHGGLILHSEVGIGYELPWRQVEAMLLLAAERTPGLNRDPRPFVLLLKLGDFAVTYELNAYCTEARSIVALYAAMHRSILDVFNEHGVQIMTPAYEGDPEVPKVVAPAEWYMAPAVKPAPEPEPVGGRRG